MLSSITALAGVRVPVINATATITAAVKTALAADPDVELTGIPLTTADGKSMVDIAYNAVVETIETLPKARKRDPDAVAESVTRAVRGAIAGQWSKKPICHVHVLQV